MILTYKYRIKDKSAKKFLNRHAYACNQVWNYCAAQQLDIQDRYHAGARPRKWASHFELTKMIKGAGKLLGTNQQTASEICRVFVQGRNKNRRSPKFRSSFGTKRSLGWVPFQSQGRKVFGNAVIFAGHTYRFFGSKRRPLPLSVKGGAFVEDSLGRWFVCFNVEIPGCSRRDRSSIGIDLGLHSLLTTSDGKKITAPRIYRNFQTKIASAQRARKMQRLRAIHIKIKNSRKDFIHKTTTMLARDYTFIAVGNAGKHLIKTPFAKSIFDAGWAILRDQLSYKAYAYMSVDERFTTQTCSCCGSLTSNERPQGIAGLSKRSWKCSDCGEIHDRDVNAAKNILFRALSAQRLVGGSQISMDKHEPHGSAPP